MIPFPPLRTRRHTIELRELTIGEAIYLAKLNPAAHEASVTALLERAAGEDTLDWTVQERGLAVAHYMAQTMGDPDFALGDLKFSDYFVPDEAPDEVELGYMLEDHWSMRPLLGRHAETIERFILGGSLEATRMSWWMGAMACQLRRPTEKDPAPEVFDTWLAGRITVLQALPESAFLELFGAFLAGQRQLNRLLNLDFTDEGAVFTAREVPAAAPARFLVPDCLADATRQILGIADRAPQ